MSLRLALDFPQLFTYHNIKTESGINKIFDNLLPIKHYISGVHLWGKTSTNGRKIAHCGTLDTFFENEKLKNLFLERFYELFDDDISRYLVLEVNSSNQDLECIVQDLLNIGCKFI